MEEAQLYFVVCSVGSGMVDLKLVQSRKLSFGLTSWVHQQNNEPTHSQKYQRLAGEKHWTNLYDFILNITGKFLPKKN